MGRNTIARVVMAAAMLSVVGLPGMVGAQPRRGRGRQPQTTQPAEPPPGGESGTMEFTTGEENTTPTQPGQGEQGSGGTTAAQPSGSQSGGDLGLLGGTDVTAARHPLSEEIYAVQQIYALRNRRVELSPSVNIALNDPFVGHTGFGLGVNYWITNVLSVGLSGVFFQGLNTTSETNYQFARSTGLVVPINEYQLAASLNFSYVPLYGKFSMFNRFIFHWDMYLMAGVGIMRSRPIPVVDPEIRTFSWGTSIMFNAGIGARVFLSRSVGVTLELRNYIYPELLENTRIGPEAVGGRTDCSTCRRNPQTWTSENALTDNVMLSVGLTIFLPFSFSYRLPK